MGTELSERERAAPMESIALYSRKESEFLSHMIERFLGEKNLMLLSMFKINVNLS